eukprot:1365986-Rhodomonas_salina.2
MTQGRVWYLAGPLRPSQGTCEQPSRSRRTRLQDCAGPARTWYSLLSSYAANTGLWSYEYGALTVLSLVYGSPNTGLWPY